MSEMNPEGEPVFVDVDSGQQFPTLFSQLITAEEATALAKAGSSKRIERVKVEENGNESKTIKQPIKKKSRTKIAKVRRTYPCDVCGQYTTNKRDNLIRHMRLHRCGEETLITNEEKTSNEPKGPMYRLYTDDDTQQQSDKPSKKAIELHYHCDVCLRFRTDTEENLIRHLRRHRGENAYQCGMCDYSTYNKAVFEEHVRVHQGIKPFKCSYCDYKSASKKNAKKHEKIHSDDNPNKCKDCDFIGRNPQSFKHHRETKHNDEKPKRVLTCKHCNMRFSTKSKYHGHRKNTKKCPKCDIKYCNLKIFYEHMKEAHNEDAGAYSNIKKSRESKLFNCGLCKWSSSSKPRILLHLIHHPNQEVDESVIDLTVLRNCGIIE